MPVAQLDSIGDACLIFFLYIFVPDPSVMGRARHRINADIQKRFEAAGIVIPIPIQELRVHALHAAHHEEPQILPRAQGPRQDPKHTPAPHFIARSPLPEPAEPATEGWTSNRQLVRSEMSPTHKAAFTTSIRRMAINVGGGRPVPTGARS